MTRLDQRTSRLSLRNSILVWVAGIVIGWGCAVVLFYQLIRDASEERGIDAPALMAESSEAVGLADIAPAAGGEEAAVERTSAPDTDQTTRQARAAIDPAATTTN